MSTPEAFVEAIHSFFSGVRDPQHRRLLLLACLGELGPYSYGLSLKFRELGIVHLLVLSGSQVNSYSEGMRFCFSKLLPSCLDERRKRFYLSGFLYGGLWVFGQAGGWPPPLTRALLVEGVRTTWPGLGWLWGWLLALLIQVLLFRHHASAVGFYLSWAASLSLKWGQVFRWSMLSRLITVSLLGQTLVSIWIRSGEPIVLVDWIWVVLANLCVGSLFERTLMRVCGWILAGAFGVAILLNLTDFVWILNFWRFMAVPARLFLEGASSLVLVAVDAFRYIQ